MAKKPPPKLVTSLPPMDDDQLEWESAIGKFMVAFTAIEQVIDLIIMHFSSNRLADAVLDLPFERRCTIAHALAADQSDNALRWIQIKDEINRATQLAKSRNLVAHNSPSLSIYVSEDGQVQVKRELKNLRKGKQITLPELDRRTVEAKELSLRLYNLLTSLKKYQKPGLLGGSALDAKE